MRAKITRRVLDAEGKRLDGAERWVWDTECRGFYARHRRRKDSRWIYGLKYRAGGRGRYHTVAEDGEAIPAEVCERLGLALGSTWGPEPARREAERVRGNTRAGHDPGADREMPTLRAFAKRYLAEHVEPVLKPRTAAAYADLLKRHVLPALGDQRLDRIDRAAVTRFALKLKSKPTTANRALAVLGSLYSRAGAWGVVPDEHNPVRRVPRFREAKRERFLSADELARLGAALRKVEGEGVSPFAIGALRFLVLTGARPSEALALEWPMLDLQRGVAMLPDSKTGAKVLRLSPPAVQLLKGLPRVEGDARVFVPRRSGAPAADINTAWGRVRRAAKLDGVRLYDAARHSFASLAVSDGASLYLVGSLLGHKRPTTTQRYAHLSDDPLDALAAKVGKRIAAALDGKPKARRNVTPIAGRRRRAGGRRS